MSIVNTLDRITEWAQKNLCEPVKFKTPPKEDEAKVKKTLDRNLSGDQVNDGAGYEYKRITPIAFKWLVPSKDRIPDVQSPFPSICVRLSEGDSERGSGTIPVELCFSVWNPGTHGSDIIKPLEDGSYEQWTGDDAKKFFERNNDGWRDVWNWVDLALREIESTDNLNGILIDRTTVKYGPFKIEGEMADFYPFWFAYISFDVKYNVSRNVSRYDEFL